MNVYTGHPNQICGVEEMRLSGGKADEMLCGEGTAGIIKAWRKQTILTCYSRILEEEN